MKDEDRCIDSIEDALQKLLPSGSHAYLYGSQARGDARPDSDWDILILLDKQKIEAEDYDNVSYPWLNWGGRLMSASVLYSIR